MRCQLYFRFFGLWMLYWLYTILVRLSRTFFRTGKILRQRRTIRQEVSDRIFAQFKVWKTKESCMYFWFFKLKKWGKKAAETRRRNCAVLP